MINAGKAPYPRLRVGILLWSAATLGAVAVTVAVLPQVSAKTPLPAPLWLITAAGAAQSALIVALAVWTGVSLAPGVGLRAPGVEAAALRRPVMSALKPQILPGLIAGLLGGFWLFVALQFSAVGKAAQQGPFSVPLFARIAYGGITEEVLLRWGLMTAVTSLAWRFVQRKRGEVNAVLIWAAIGVSSVLFAVGHLPAASFLLGSLNGPIVLFVVGVNVTFGVLFGWLFWRWGLEAAMIAHAMTHFVSYVITQFGGAAGPS